MTRRQARMEASLLARGLDDWVDAAEVSWICRDVGGASSEDQIREMALDLLNVVLMSGYMQAGELTSGGFVAWPLSSEAALGRIAVEWEELGRGPSLGELFWLDLTPTGERRAVQLCGSQ
jgi:hypothetical protein